MERPRLQQKPACVKVEEPIYGGLAREGPGGGEDRGGVEAAELGHS